MVCWACSAVGGSHNGGAPMFARVTTSQGSPDQLDQAIRYIQEQVIPAARQKRGPADSALSSQMSGSARCGCHRNRPRANLMGGPENRCGLPAARNW